MLRVEIACRVSKLVPRSVLYWCVIRAWALATTEKFTDLTPDKVTIWNVLNFLDGSEDPKPEPQTKMTRLGVGIYDTF